MAPRGVVAAGHAATAEAAAEVLRAGGNAFDAAVAACFTACIAEPVLCSLAGGGFLLACPAGGRPRVYDFFVQTPRRRRPMAELDFHPVTADFGTARQEFHIGLGAAATPGCVAGLFAVNRELGRMPMAELAAPATALAREGLTLNEFQAYIFSIVAPIYLATPGARAVFAEPGHPGRIVGSGAVLRQPQQADFMEALCREGPDLFHRGEVAAAVEDLCREGGGHLTRGDLTRYAVARHPPLAREHLGAQVLLTPPPSAGGLLVAAALALLHHRPPPRPWGSPGHLRHLARVLSATDALRGDILAHGTLAPGARERLEEARLREYLQRLAGPPARRGTTHVSIIDAAGNLAAMTVSNGEGCGHLIPGTGVMLNNMLGEADLHPGGFHRWPEDRRMTSMMTPGAVLGPGPRRIALGSGGSNRIRSALAQVLSNLLHFDLAPGEAVARPRLHVEGGHLSLEGGHDPEAVAALTADWPGHTVWQDRNLFFGGAHLAVQDGAAFTGAGDPRRGGVSLVVD